MANVPICQLYSREIITNSSLKAPRTALYWGGIKAGTVPHNLSFIRNNRFHVHLICRYMTDVLGATYFMHISSAGMCQTQHTSSSVLHHVFTSGLRLRRSKMLWSLRQYLQAQPRTSHHQSPGGERHGKRKHLVHFSERMREGNCYSDKNWNCFKGNIGDTSKRGVECTWDLLSA